MHSPLTLDVSLVGIRPRGATRLAVGLLVVFALPTSRLVADSPQRGDERPSVVLLHNGQTLSGVVRRSRDHVEIHQTGTRIRVPRHRVRWIGDSLEAVYRYQQRHLSSQSAPAHLRLASWCLEQRLHDEAARHFASALEANPAHPEIEILRRRLLNSWARDVQSPQDRVLGSGQRATRGRAVQTASFAVTAPPREPGPTVDRATMRSFTHRVQPLLVNQCGTSGCHGSSSTSGFRLSDSRWDVGPPATITRQNLLAVLELVLIEDPDASPLLRQAGVAHGTDLETGRPGSGRQSRNPPLNAEQLEGLRRWIAELSPKAFPTALGSMARTARGEHPSDNFSPENQRRSATADPFDPRVFNEPSVDRSGAE